jgi:2-methylcitrate dehydratase PrpD
MEKSLGMQLAKFAVQTKYGDLPPEVLRFTKGLILKTVAGMMAGSIKPSGRKMAEFIKSQRLPEVVGIMGSNFKTSLWEAVFLHAYFAHASELEDDRFNGGISWDITVIPLLFPLAEKLNMSGRDLLAAITVALEVHIRTCSFSAEHLGLVMIPGAAGPAVGAARALGLDVNGTAAALGLSLSGVPCSMISFGTDAHFLESALQSLQGIIAADMAKMGLTGNPDVGFFLTNYLGKERVKPEKIVENIGKEWLIPEIWIKKYPCCFLQHRHIDAIIELRNTHHLSFDDVESIEVHASPPEMLCDRPDPKTEGDLQFSFQHSLSSAMLDGDVNMQHISEEAVSDKRLAAARSKVKIVLDPKLPQAFFGAPAKVNIRMKDGRTFSGQRNLPIGHPKEPLSQEQYLHLYSKFMKEILPDGLVSRTADMLMNLEKLPDMKELLNILVRTQ